MSRRDDNDSAVFEESSMIITLGYVALFALCGLGLLVLSLIWGDHLPMSFADLTGDDVSSQGLGHVWFIFIWALGATLVIWMFQGSACVDQSRAVRLFKGMWVSLNAGIFEEVIFRWLLFFVAMLTLQFFNLITLGLVKWFYTEVLIPVANFFTFHALDNFLTGSPWVIGAAIISVNATFRDGHKHLGTFGWVNAWFMGMIMFYLTLNYGIQTAIVAHVLYDAIIFALCAVAVKNPYGRRSGYDQVVWNTGWDR